MTKRIRAIASCCVSISVLLLASRVNADTENICQLDANINAILEHPDYAQAQWGIAIQDLAENNLLYAKNADHFFIPASNLKLFTTAAALDTLGKDHQFSTEVYTVGAPPQLDRLIIRGGGDPSLSSDELAEIAQLLNAQQITTIENIIVDDSLFTELAIHPSWEWSDLAFYYGVPVNSLMIDENATVLELTPSSVGQPANITESLSGAIALGQWHIENQLITSEAGTEYQGDITQKFGTTELVIKGQIPADAEPDIWGLSIPDPARYALDQLAFSLAQQGITTNTQAVTTTGFEQYETASLLTTITSPALSTILQTTNQKSNNLYAESLRHTLGSLNPDLTGAEAIATTLVDLGLNENSFQIKDGSGLSRHNLATPRSFTQLLDVMADHPDATIYRNSLAIAAETGTLTRRFQDSPVAGQFFGKTGTMTNISDLSGYLDLSGDRTLALSILVNQSPQTASITRQGIDAIVNTTYQWGENCLQASPSGTYPDITPEAR